MNGLYRIDKLTKRRFYAIFNLYENQGCFLFFQRVPEMEEKLVWPTPSPNNPARICPFEIPKYLSFAMAKNLHICYPTKIRVFLYLHCY